jgi:hypothetical protein
MDKPLGDFRDAFETAASTRRSGSDDETAALRWVAEAAGLPMDEWNEPSGWEPLGEQRVFDRKKGRARMVDIEFGAKLPPLAAAVFLGLPRTAEALLGLDADPDEPIQLETEDGDAHGLAQISAVRFASGWSGLSPKESADCLGPLLAARERLRGLAIASEEAGELQAALRASPPKEADETKEANDATGAPKGGEEPAAPKGGDAARRL